MINYNISINEDLAKIVEQQVNLGKYANRSEFFRDIIRSLFVPEKELDIEPIMPRTDEYKRLQKIVKNKNNFVPYSQLRKELGLQ